MPARKRAATTTDGDGEEPVAKRRSSRQAAATATASSKSSQQDQPKAEKRPATKAHKSRQSTEKKRKAPSKPLEQPSPPQDESDKDKSRAASEDPDPELIPAHNPEAARHSGTWYWLMKAEPESRFENGIDVSFSIDDLRSCTRPEGWDGIRAYAARNNLRQMNAGDRAFFYHSNCKNPAIVGTMEIVREFSEDKSARRPGTPYYDPSSTKEKPRWSLVHVEFRRKFAVPITLPELRELGKAGGPLEEMQMLRQSRLSVSKVSTGEWEALCELADRKAKEAGLLEHEDGK